MDYADDFLYDKPSVLIGRKGSIGKVKYIEEPFGLLIHYFTLLLMKIL